MKVQKPKRDVFFGYVTIQLVVFGLPFMILYGTTGNLWWGLGIVVGYLFNEVPVWYTMKNGIPEEIVLPRLMAPPKNSSISTREAFLRWKMLFAHKALACGYAMLLFGVLVVYNTGNASLSAIIATAGAFGIWQAFKGVRYFAHVSGRHFLPRFADSTARHCWAVFLFFPY